MLASAACPAGGRRTCGGCIGRTTLTATQLVSPAHPACSPYLQVGAAAEYEPGKLSGAVALDTDFEAGVEAEHADYLALIDGDTSGLDGGSWPASGGSESPLQWAQNFLDEAALYSGGHAGDAVVHRCQHSAWA
jgi:hypothetical protein